MSNHLDRLVEYAANFVADRRSNRDNSPLSEWIAYGFDITVLLVTEQILPVFAKEAKVP